MTVRTTQNPPRAPALIGDTRGAALLEFALVLPVFAMMLLGLFDFGQTIYVRSVLHGAVEDAARSSSLETADTTAADAMVRKVVTPIAPGATINSSRLSYVGFGDVGRAERWNDANDNAICDDGENYTDENGDGQWNSEIGVSGNGGASDVVVYTVDVTFNRLFKIPLLPGSDQRTVTARAVRKNEPFADQPGYGSRAGTC